MPSKDVLKETAISDKPHRTAERTMTCRWVNFEDRNPEKNMVRLRPADISIKKLDA